MRILILLCLAFPFAAIVAAADAHDPAAPRFAVKASLEAAPPAVGDARFQLRGTLQPRTPQPVLSGVGFVLKAALSPKNEPICYGPGHIFADGYETP
ncbi:MAG TPA: hypothetical protein PKZ76_04705 [Xanthomonadaceae bacterium]|nr:hypothetical protein [Xanthomonadaceae bacterium]